MLLLNFQIFINMYVTLLPIARSVRDVNAFPMQMDITVSTLRGPHCQFAIFERW